MPIASRHVENPQKAVVVFGLSIEELRKRHDELAAVATTTTRTGQVKNIRLDQNTLCCIVCSHPSTVLEMNNNPEIAEKVADWEELTLAWATGKYGPDFVSAVRHTDESHPHLHLYLLPNDPAMNAGRFHEGRMAKKAEMQKPVRTGETAKDHNRRGDDAYKSAMRDWQDSYHNSVGIKAGLTRLGPKVRRLTRAEWKAEKVQASSLQSALTRASALQNRWMKAFKRRRDDLDEIEMQIELAKERAEMLGEMHKKWMKQYRKNREDAALMMQQAADAVQTSKGAGGQIRAIIDGFKESSIEKRIRESLNAEIADVEKAKAKAEETARIEREKRREAENRAKAAHDALNTAIVERDRARALVLDQPKVPHPSPSNRVTRPK